MVRSPVSWLVGIVLPGVLCAATVFAQDSRPPEWCATKDPQSVLQCLEEAFDSRDIILYEKLLAPDFKFSFVVEGTGWDRRQDLASVGDLFANSLVSGIDYELEKEVQVTPGKEPGTWLLHGMTSVLRMEMVVKGSATPLEVRCEKMTFLVQRIERPEPHYVILEWQDHGP